MDNENNDINAADLYFEGVSSCCEYEKNTLDRNFPNGSSLNIIHVNIRSISKNLDELKLLLADIKMYFSVVVLTETWLDNDHNWLPSDWFDNYDVFHSIRAGRRGGGVSILADRGLGCVRLEELCLIEPTFESCAISFTINRKQFSVVGVYRPPMNLTADFNTSFFENLNRSRISNHVSFVLGDFNIDLLNNNNSNAHEAFIGEFNSHHFMPVISLPTRVTNNTSSLIDHIWVNSLAPCSSGVIPVAISDHYPIFISLPNVFEDPEQFVTCRYRMFSDVNIDNYRTKLEEFLTNFYFLNDLDLQTKCKIFCNCLYSIFNECFPIKSKRASVKRLSCPWLSRSLRKCIDKKHALYKGMKSGRTDPSAYKRYRNILCNVIRNVKRDYYEQKFSSCIGDIKQTWRNINQVTRPRHPRATKFSIEDNSGLVEDDFTVAELFNNYFSSVGTNIANNIPLTNVNPIQYVSRNPNSFALWATSIQEIISIVSNFKNKPCDLQSIPNKIYKSIMDILAPPISGLINESFETGEFPDNLKVARVIPLFKSGNKSMKSNYRPISILHTVSKIFERAMYNRLSSFADKFDLLSINQFGFRRALSTADAILKFTNGIYDSFNNRSITMAVFLDFQKAFDTINHKILLDKLERLGVRGICLSWFESYLKNRKQYVKINCESSSLSDISTGCPQGSVLSSLLFSLYINDMSKCAPNLNFYHYADDTTICFNHDNINILIDNVNEGLSAIGSWLQSNKLSLNVNKSNFILFTNKLNLPPINIHVDGTRIERIKSGKFLGVMIDERLSFKEHIGSICKKLYRSCGVIGRVADILPSSSIRCLYSALVLPHLSYCVEIWGRSSATELTKLVSLQSRCVKQLRTDCEESIDDLFVENKLLPFHCIHKLFTLARFHKYLHNSHFFLIDKLQPMQNHHSHNTRLASTGHLMIGAIHSSKYFNSFFYQGVQLYNSLPPDIKEITILNKFKYSVKQWLLLDLA